MSDETTARNHEAEAQPKGQAREAETPAVAGPHSPGSAKRKKTALESGGYEQHQADHSTSNAKGGYGAG